MTGLRLLAAFNRATKGDRIMGGVTNKIRKDTVLIFKNERVMANFNELERLGERFPNKNVGCGNPDSKILVVTQKVGNEKEDFKYLRKLFVKILGAEDVLDLCYYVVYDEELLKDSFFEHFQAIIYTFIDGSQLDQQNPGRLLGMEWVSDCNVEDGAIQRLFVAHSKAEADKPERMMLCTYTFDKVSHTILKCSRLLLNWFLLSQKENNPQ
ncbi:MAG: hypothetical protein IKH05_07845 [Bacteroidaceae bacterium]|nr:hypothetical protein [Bacteroidaceae bacterium]